jgi:hypothetical protein
MSAELFVFLSYHLIYKVVRIPSWGAMASYVVGIFISSGIDLTGQFPDYFMGDLKNAIFEK